LTTTSRSEADTARAAQELAAQLEPDDVLLLTGDLGAGKTAFVRGLAQGLGIDPDEVSSPTFTLIHEYRGGRLSLYHIDLYRLSSREVDDLGLDDLIEAGGIVAIEWAERWPGAPAGSVRVDLRTTGATERTISITPRAGAGDAAQHQ
jgi:tRNA threonylcarbamoyladenosine biosynthesis protein TsaE